MAERADDHYITREIDKRMGVWDPKNEEIQHQYRETSKSIELNETQQFGFSVFEHDIHALIYTWYHPNLNLISSGVMVVQGIRPFVPGLDIHDYRMYLSADEIKNGLRHFKTSSNLEVEVLEPGVKFRTKYLDKQRNSSFDIVHTAIHPPQVWSSNVHFEQPMRNVGEVVIRGKRYDVNGTQTRDRSWGEMRSEVPRNIPPICWITGIFDNGFCFHTTAFDTEDMDPVWKGKFHVPPENALRFGWVVVDGKSAVVRKVRKHTDYDSHLLPTRMVLELTDEHNRTFKISGECTAGYPFHVWHNSRWPIMLTRWTLDGKVGGWGDIQDGQWADWILSMSGR